MITFNLKKVVISVLLVCVLAWAGAVLAQAPGVIVSEAQIKSFPLSAEALGNARANEAIEVRSEIDSMSVLKQDVRSLMVPETAIVPERSKQFVFVVNDDGLAELREISTGRRRPGEVEVIETKVTQVIEDVIASIQCVEKPSSTSRDEHTEIRVEFSPKREAMAARSLAVADVESALRAENVELPAGRLEPETREFTLRTETGFIRVDDFRQLVVSRGPDGQIVRLGEVADVRIGAKNERTAARVDGSEAVTLAMEQLSKANSMAVSDGV